ncbi:2552_t:CDS:2, partial [Paraglomus occultum]
GIMDMTPKSDFVKQIPDELYKKYLMSLESFDNLIPEETHEFFVNFFEQDLTCQQRSDAVDALDGRDYKEDAFSLEHMNPLLQNAEALEAPHLNNYIHPCFKAALWQCGNVYYSFGEIPSVGQQRGDGSGLTVDADKYEIVYVEGSHSAKVEDGKELNDQSKIAFNLRKMLFDIVKDRVEKR